MFAYRSSLREAAIGARAMAGVLVALFSLVGLACTTPRSVDVGPDGAADHPAADGASPDRSASGGTSGTDARVDVSSGADAPAADAGGVDAGCPVDIKQCNGLQPQTCNAGGQWDNTGAACTTVCIAGGCAGVCAQGAKQCNGLQPQTCNASGQWDNAGSACTNVCGAGVCSGVCTPNAVQCSGLQPQQCDATGQWQSMGATCPSVCTGGSCTACTPSAKRCNALQPQTCDNTGAWQNTGTACPFVCNTTMGACTGTCTPAAKQCNALQPQTCDNTGTWQSTGSACPFVCINASGLCSGSCAPMSKSCNGAQPQVCDGNGTPQNVGAACGMCTTCSTSTGACAPVTDGTTCTDNNACTVGDSCQSGVCMPGANTGCVAMVTISPSTPVTFPSTVISGSSSPLTFMVANGGTVAAGTTTALSITTTGTNAGDFMIASSTCPLTLGAGANCSVSVTFNPAAAGSRTANLVVSATPGGSASEGLSGTGLAPASLSLAAMSGAASPINYGIVRLGSSSVQTFQITNSGQQSSSAVTVTVSGADFSLVSPGTGDCVSGTTVLAAGKSCTVRVQLAPTGSSGLRNGSLSASATTGGTPPTLTLTGNALPPSGMFHEYPVPVGNFNAFEGLLGGPDGYVWFLEDYVGKVVATTGGVVFDFVTLPSGTNYGAFIVGPDLNIWLIETDDNSLNKITTSGTRTTVVPNLPIAIIGLSKGPPSDASNLWFTETGNVGRMTTAGVVLNQFPTPSGNTPTQIAVGPDGNMWFVEAGLNKIGKSTPAGAITEYTIPTANSTTYAVTAGGDGNMWFVETQANKIGKITPAGVFTEYTVPVAPGTAVGGPDGNVWFTEPAANKVCRITPTGTVTEFTPPTAGSQPYLITLGPDSNLWFTEQTANNIGTVTY